VSNDSTRTAAAVSLLATLIASQASGGIVHIQVERRAGVEFGAGYTVARDTECFIVTPQHVVNFATPDSIRITDSDGTSAKARVVKEIPDFDVALLRVTESAPIDCQADWSDGTGAAAAIGEAPFLVARRLDDAGRTIQTRFFVSSASPEEITLQPYRADDELREGDSGSSLYAGSELVGMITSVDTASGEASGITQTQIHGLFGPDVLPNALARAIVLSIKYRSREDAYATTAAREYLSDSGSMQVLRTPLDGVVDTSVADYVISGQILQIARTRENNPDYEPPKQDDDADNPLQRLFRNAQRELEQEIDDRLERNTDARYLHRFTIDVQIEIQDLAQDRLISNLETIALRYPSNSTNLNESQTAAVSDAVKQALRSTLTANDIL
jgi:hypothetical protein